MISIEIYWPHSIAERFYAVVEFGVRSRCVNVSTLFVKFQIFVKNLYIYIYLCSFLSFVYIASNINFHLKNKTVELIYLTETNGNKQQK